jgi:hypothetical protein
MPKKPVTADRQVRIVFSTSRYGSRKVALVSQVVEIPEGNAAVSATLLLPQLGGFSDESIEVFEGGQRLDDLSSDQIGLTQSGWNWTEARPAMLFIDSDVQNHFRQQQRDLRLARSPHAGRSFSRHAGSTIESWRTPDATQAEKARPATFR